MYNELYAVWQLETEHSVLAHLPSDFYTRLISYLQKLNELETAFTEQNLKNRLVAHEAINAKRMVEELVNVRYNKIIRMLISQQEIPKEVLASEEISLCDNLLPSTETYAQFATSLLAGKTANMFVNCPNTVAASQSEHKKAEINSAIEVANPVTVTHKTLVTNKRVTIRFLNMVPAIVGSDMKTYGPFMIEDVASVPESNAKILIRQGLAKPVEFS